MFKFHFEFEAKAREKIDKKELEDIERRMMENVELQVNNRTKKFSEKTDLKKLKLQTDK